MKRTILTLAIVIVAMFSKVNVKSNHGNTNGLNVHITQTDSTTHNIMTVGTTMFLVGK